MFLSSESFDFINIESLNIDPQTKCILKKIQDQNEARKQEINDLKSVCNQKDNIISDLKKQTIRDTQVEKVFIRLILKYCSYYFKS